MAEIEAALIATSNPERARNEKRYLKSDLRFIGVAKPLIRRAVRPALRSGAISDPGLTPWISPKRMLG